MQNASVYGDIEANTPQRTSPSLRLARLTRTLRRSLQGQRSFRTNRLPASKLEALFRQEPLLKRGITKHSGDLFRPGFLITEANATNKHGGDDVVQAWWRDREANRKGVESITASHVYGDGVLEIEWDDGGDSTDPVRSGAFPEDVHVVDPVHVDFRRERHDGEDLVVLDQRVPGEDPVRLHPDRYHHFRLTSLPGFDHGLSTVELAWHTAMAKLKGDQGSGEAVYFAGHGKFLAKLKDGDDDAVDAVVEMLNDPDFVRAWVWDDDLSMEQFEATLADIQPYYEVWRDSIAAAIGLPSMMLVGAQAGRVTGSETNLVDYHADLHMVQRNVLEPFVNRISGPLLGQDKTGFDVLWYPYPLSPDMEAAALRDKFTALNLAIGARVKREKAAQLLDLDLNEGDFEKAPPGVVPPVTPATNVEDTEEGAEDDGRVAD